MFDPAPSYDDAELIKRIVAIERRLDIIETFHIRLWTGSPIGFGTFTSTTISCGTVFPQKTSNDGYGYHGSYQCDHNKNEDSPPCVRGA